jgi:hypothetical protein
VQPEDLSAEAASAFRVWRWMGVSESAVMDLLHEDGLLPTTELDQLTKTFREVFDMSKGAARVAADGRGGPSLRPVSETAGRSSAAPQPGDALRLVVKIEELAANLCRRGVSDEKALREAAFAVFQAAPDDQTQDWVAQVTGRRWPGLWGRPVSTSGGKGSSWSDRPRASKRGQPDRPRGVR